MEIVITPKIKDKNKSATERSRRRDALQILSAHILRKQWKSIVPSNSFIYPSTREEEGGEVFHKQINSMKDAVYSAVFQSLVRRVDDKRATMVVRYYISGGLGRAGLRGWPSVEESLVGDRRVVRDDARHFVW